jgi:hypothetical protein
MSMMSSNEGTHGLVPASALRPVEVFVAGGEPGALTESADATAPVAIEGALGVDGVGAPSTSLAAVVEGAVLMPEVAVVDDGTDMSVDGIEMENKGGGVQKRLPWPHSERPLAPYIRDPPH